MQVGGNANAVSTFITEYSIESLLIFVAEASYPPITDLCNSLDNKVLIKF